MIGHSRTPPFREHLTERSNPHITAWSGGGVRVGGSAESGRTLKSERGKEEEEGEEVIAYVGHLFYNRLLNPMQARESHLQARSALERMDR